MCDDLTDPIKRWERYADAANKEKDWMHSRLNWLFVPQGVLFAALAFIIEQYHDSRVDDLLWLRAIVTCAGFLIALSSFIGTCAAGRMHYLWTSLSNTLAEDLNKDKPVVSFGMKPHWPARSSSVLPSFIAFVFVIAWIVLIFLSNQRCILVFTCIVLGLIPLIVTYWLLHLKNANKTN